jgi:hypothetical protein
MRTRKDEKTKPGKRLSHATDSVFSRFAGSWCVSFSGALQER